MGIFLLLFKLSRSNPSFYFRQEECIHTFGPVSRRWYVVYFQKKAYIIGFFLLVVLNTVLFLFTFCSLIFYSVTLELPTGSYN